MSLQTMLIMFDFLTLKMIVKFFRTAQKNVDYAVLVETHVTHICMLLWTPETATLSVTLKFFNY